MTLIDDLNQKHKNAVELSDKTDKDIKRMFYDFATFFADKAGLTDNDKNFCYLDKNGRVQEVKMIRNFQEYDGFADKIITKDPNGRYGIKLGIITAHGDNRQVIPVELEANQNPYTSEFHLIGIGLGANDAPALCSIP